jgi:16S rRNA (guanine(966)-N(2))-methyltransferase RsmD
MKIIGGQFKGRNFYMPHGIRPTQNLLRKSLFDILGQDMEGISLLDLFAGSGAIGFEALSRGALHVTFVEGDAKNYGVLEQNLELMYPQGQSVTHLVQSDVFASVKYLASSSKKFDVVFIDPPYGANLAKKALNLLSAYDILHPTSTVVIEHNRREALPKELGRFLLYKEKTCGASVLSFYQIAFS